MVREFVGNSVENLANTMDNYVDTAFGRAVQRSDDMQTARKKATWTRDLNETLLLFDRPFASQMIERPDCSGILLSVHRISFPLRR